MLYYCSRFFQPIILSHRPAIPSHHPIILSHRPTISCHHPAIPSHHPNIPSHHPAISSHHPAISSHHPNIPSPPPLSQKAENTLVKDTSCNPVPKLNVFSLIYSVPLFLFIIQPQRLFRCLPDIRLQQPVIAQPSFILPAGLQRLYHGLHLGIRVIGKVKGQCLQKRRLLWGTVL